MPGLLDRLFGSPRPRRDYQRGPTLAGLDAISLAAIELQKRYWTPNPDELAELEARTRSDLDWPEHLRLHHLRCLAWLDARDGAARAALLAPAGERPALDEPGALEPDLEARVRASAKTLLGRRSPYRPRHGFCWLGEGPPTGDAIPYSDYQGRIVNASLTHLGCVELITLDAELAPAAVEFVDFDRVLTLSRGVLELGADAPTPAFVPVRLLLEYGAEDRAGLLATRYGLSWLSHEPAVLRGQASHAIGAIELGGLADPGRAVGQPSGPGDGRRSLGIRVGPQQIEVLSDYEHEGLARCELGRCYQVSLAIDQDDPRFADKCAGRGLDPDATRGDVVRESRLRSSARLARKAQS